MIQTADSVQGVLFPEHGTKQEDAKNLWGRVFPGDEPDQYQKATASPTLVSTASGEREGCGVAISVQVGRINLIIGPVQPNGLAGPQDGPPRLANVPEITLRLGNYLKRISANYKITRAAIVVDFAKTAPLELVSRMMLDEIPFLNLPKDSTDINIQFNVRRSLKIDPDIALNRLCNWVTGQVGFLVGNGLVSPNQISLTPYIGMKVDVNTAPEHNISHLEIESVIDEICGEAMSIAHTGLETET